MLGRRGDPGGRRGRDAALTGLGGPSARGAGPPRPLGARPAIARAWRQPRSRRPSASSSSPPRRPRATSHGARPRSGRLLRAAGLRSGPARWRLSGGARLRQRTAAGRQTAGARAGTRQRREGRAAAAGCGRAFPRGAGPRVGGACVGVVCWAGPCRVPSCVHVAAVGTGAALRRPRPGARNSRPEPFPTPPRAKGPLGPPAQGRGRGPRRPVPVCSQRPAQGPRLANKRHLTTSPSRG